MLPMFVDQKTAQSRFDLCKKCEHLFNSTSTCKKCGCFMKIKVKLPNSACPIGKWEATVDPISEQGDD